MSQPARSGVGGVAFWGGFPLILDEGGVARSEEKN